MEYLERLIELAGEVCFIALDFRQGSLVRHTSYVKRPLYFPAAVFTLESHFFVLEANLSFHNLLEFVLGDLRVLACGVYDLSNFLWNTCSAHPKAPLIRGFR